MPKPTPTELKAEFVADPANVGYATPLAVGDGSTLTSLVNDMTKGTPMLQAVPMLLFAKFAAGSGIRQKLKNGQSSPTVGAICDTAIEMFGHLEITFDPSDPTTQAMMTALVSANIISTDDVSATNAFCTRPASRYQNLAEDASLVASLDDVSAAVRA